MLQTMASRRLMLAVACLVSLPFGQCWSSSKPFSRRVALERVAGAAIVGGASLLGATPKAQAVVPSPTDLKRLQVGHARVRYLLEHWDDITATCGSRIMSDTERKQVIRTEGGGGGSCDKTPLRVQEFMGYKSTTDPLYKADSLMIKAAPLVDDIEGYLGTVEQYREKADQTAMMAYTSSWGEANPNGGKEVIDEYLERTKEEVIQSEKLLREVLGYLNLEVLPPQATL